MSAEWVDVGAADDVSETHPLSVEVADVELVIARCASGLYAVENRCTHDGQSLSGAEIEACQIICPRRALLP
jgi:3-phenylpropionate/trans-cinnamate dioxygenase ferredoxin subunit